MTYWFVCRCEIKPSEERCDDQQTHLQMEDGEIFDSFDEALYFAHDQSRGIARFFSGIWSVDDYWNTRFVGSVGFRPATFPTDFPGEYNHRASINASVALWCQGRLKQTLTTRGS